jgi:endonuclease YncB( thermonuclease family)
MILAALALAASVPFKCYVASVHDGDTMRCADGTRIRLQGIDANELDGTCHHACAAGTADEARHYLEVMALGRAATCIRTGTSYRRVTAWCRVDNDLGPRTDLSCAQVAAGHAIIWRRYDPHHRLDHCAVVRTPVMLIP